MRKVFWRKKIIWKMMYGPLEWTMELETKMWTPGPDHLLCVYFYHCIFWVMKCTEVICRVLWRITELLRTVVSSVIITCHSWSRTWFYLEAWMPARLPHPFTALWYPEEVSRTLLLVKRVKVAHPVMCSGLLNAVANMSECWMTA